jgi:release factor glutamine methyltransferase
MFDGTTCIMHDRRRMTIQEAIAGSDLTKADAEVLLAHLLQKDRTWLLAHAEDELSGNDLKRWKEWAQRRLKGEPVAYIVGMKEFYGRPYRVNSAVLVPRPATETLVEIALQTLNRPEPQRFIREIDSDIAALVDVWEPGITARAVADIGTGSGCIAVTVALERPDLTVIATDLSPEALVVARENASALGARKIDFRLGDALTPLQDLTQPFLLISNPPYIPEGAHLDPDVQDYEPHEALFSGKDGTDVITRILAQAQTHPQCIGVILECRMDQTKKLSA